MIENFERAKRTSNRTCQPHAVGAGWSFVVGVGKEQLIPGSNVAPIMRLWPASCLVQTRKRLCALHEFVVLPACATSVRELRLS